MQFAGDMIVVSYNLGELKVMIEELKATYKEVELEILFSLT